MSDNILSAARDIERSLVGFLADLIGIRSLSSQEGDVVSRVREEMQRCGYDEVTVDPMGNVIGRIGSGPNVLALDGHVDTVDIGNRALWHTDPFHAVERDGRVYGRGACDMKGGLASIVYVGKLVRDLGLGSNVTLFVVGSVQEEDCDGLCWQYILREDRMRPQAVVIAEPTDLGLYRGHRGRMEMEVRTQGISCHGSAPERGVNAIYRMAPIIREIEGLNERLAGEAFLGKGSVTISEVRSTSPSLCAVADSCTIHLDRRLAAPDTMGSAVKEVESLQAVATSGAEVAVLDYAVPSWRGLVYPTKKYYPTWLLPEAHPLLRSGVTAYERLFHEPPRIGRWVFSTNGVAIMGMHGIPCIGFGPGNEIHAHAPDEHVLVDQLVKAAAWYAAFVAQFQS